MFVVKYHAKGKPTKYFSKDSGLVISLSAATAFGEDFREKFENACNGPMMLKTLKVSEVAEELYRHSFCKVSDIRW